MDTYNKIVHHLKCLKLPSIGVENPIASGVIDFSDSGDLFTDLLSLKMKQTLMYYTFHDNTFSTFPK
jgi:hypothetical protein